MLVVQKYWLYHIIPTVNSSLLVPIDVVCPPNIGLPNDHLTVSSSPSITSVTQLHQEIFPAQPQPQHQEIHHPSTQAHPSPGGQIRTLPLVLCQEPCSVPRVVTTAEGFQVTPAPEELVRLEGHHWATQWAQGGAVAVVQEPW